MTNFELCSYLSHMAIVVEYARDRCRFHVDRKHAMATPPRVVWPEFFNDGATGKHIIVVGINN